MCQKDRADDDRDRAKQKKGGAEGRDRTKERDRAKGRDRAEWREQSGGKNRKEKDRAKKKSTLT